MAFLKEQGLDSEHGQTVRITVLKQSTQVLLTVDTFLESSDQLWLLMSAPCWHQLLKSWN